MEILRPVLYEYFDKTANVLEAAYLRSKGQNASSNLGKNRENFCNEFLEKVLPAKLNIGSGEILDGTGNRTGQLDTVILREDAPVLDYGGANTYLAEGVFAVLEIKSNLTTKKLNEAIKTFSLVEKLKIDSGTFFTTSKNYLVRPLRILVAYEGMDLNKIADKLVESNNHEIFDLICILNQGVLVKKGNMLKFEEAFSLAKGQAVSLGFLYFYLIQYGNSFIGKIMDFHKYFMPLNNWNK